MNCFNCGASVSGEHKNCPYCGQSMQIVPDYNFLDDDNINVLMKESSSAETEKSANQESAERIRARKKKELEREKQRKLEAKKQRQMIAIIIAVVVVCGLLFCAFFAVNGFIQKQNESSYDYQVEQAEKALKENDFNSAKEYYYKALEIKPKDLDVRFTLAGLFSEQNMKKEMVAMYEEILKIDPQNYTAYKMLFQYYNSINDVDAIMELRKGVTEDRIMSLFQDYAVESPTIKLEGGTYQGSIDVMISSKLSYEIYYTLDGSDPTKNGILYEGTIRIDKNGMSTLKAVSKNEKGIFSNVVQETYFIELKAPDDPVIKPEGIYTFDTETYIQIIVPSGCTAYYAWDLNEAEVDIRSEDANRLAYSDGIRIPSGSHKLTLVIIDNTSGLASTIYRHMYTCTLDGIPVPEQFLETSAEESSEGTVEGSDDVSNEPSVEVPGN